MGSDWGRKTLGDVIELKRGYDLPKKSRVAGSIPLVSSAGVSDFHNEAKVKGPGVVTGRYGTIGEVFYSEEDFWPLNTTLYVRDFKGNDEKFIYYFLKTIDYLQYSDKAAVPGVNRNHLHMAEVFFPEDVATQKKIAEILGTIDQKIALNRQINTTLESMAQALFKSWFVDFDPVIDNALAAGNDIPEPLIKRAEARAARRASAQANKAAPENSAVPAAQGDSEASSDTPLPVEIQQLFPDAFVFTEEMGWVPEGWEVAKVAELLDLSYGKSLPATKRIDGTVPVYGSGGISGYHNEHLVNAPGIIVGRKGTVGSLYWVEEDFFPIDTVFFVENKTKLPLYWLYQILGTLNIAGMGADSAVPGVNRNNVYACSVVVPKESVTRAYRGFIDSLNSKKKFLKTQNDNLSALRDSLLPKLLSGQITIPDAEQQLAEVL